MQLNRESCLAWAFVLVVVLFSVHQVDSQPPVTDEPAMKAEDQDVSDPKKWRISTWVVLVVVAFWVLSNLLCCMVSIPRLIEQRRVIKAKNLASRRANSFKKKDPRSLQHQQEQSLLGSPAGGQESYEMASIQPMFDDGFSSYNPRAGSMQPNRSHLPQYTGARRFQNTEDLNRHLDRVGYRQEAAISVYEGDFTNDEFTERDLYPLPMDIRSNNPYYN